MRWKWIHKQLLSTLISQKYLLGVLDWKKIMGMPKLWFWKLSKVTWLHWKAGMLVYVFSFLRLSSLGWDLHLVFCSFVDVPVLCSILWDHSASYPKCRWAQRHVNLPWGLAMNINIVTNILESLLKITKVLSETVPSFELGSAKKSFCIPLSLNLMHNAVQGMPRNTSWYTANTTLKKEGTSGGRIPPRSIDYSIRFGFKSLYSV